MSNPFTDKIAIVTGAASGIGKEIARALVQRGARVVLADIHADNVAAAERELGDHSEARVVDVTDADAVGALVRDVAAQHGRLDYMFNNAGIAIFGDASKMTLDDWNRLVDINIRGVIHGVAAAYPVMIAQGRGHIVNTASAAGLAPVPGGTGYSMTKHAVVGLSTSLRAEAARYGVQVSAVCPGFIDTPIIQNAKMLEVDRDKVMDEFPLRFHSASELARAVLRGVERNKGIIVFTTFARVGWFVYRMAPGLMQRLQILSSRNNPLLGK